MANVDTRLRMDRQDALIEQILASLNTASQQSTTSSALLGPANLEPTCQCTDNDWSNDFDGTRMTIQRVRAAQGQDVDGNVLVRVKGVVYHRGHHC
jgi:hypothetical protein